MNYIYEEAFGASDASTPAMRAAIREWFSLYFNARATETEDPCQRIAYTVVNKLTKTVFGEYQATCDSPFGAGCLAGLDKIRQAAMQMALIGGECGIKPVPCGTGFRFTVVPRQGLLIFGRDENGTPTDVGCVEETVAGDYVYTLLERRTLGADGRLTISNRLYRARGRGELGRQAPLSALPKYAGLPERYTFPEPLGGVGLAWLRTPMVNCVDGSGDPVSVYAAAAGLIHAIDRNEAELNGEFRRGQSRVFASSDLLDGGDLRDELFVGLDEDPGQVGLQIFSPQLRESSFLARKQAYLRGVESVVGLKRGLLSEVESQERTATEITSSAGDYNLTVIDFQRMWEAAVREALVLCGKLGGLYRIPGAAETSAVIDWGNGILYDEDKVWADYMAMVSAGLIRPEVALGWRFNMSAETEEDKAKIRKRFMAEG